MSRIHREDAVDALHSPLGRTFGSFQENLDIKALSPAPVPANSAKC